MGRVILLLGILGFGNFVSAQSSYLLSRNKIAFNYGYGEQFFLKTDYRYTVNLYKIQFHRNFIAKKNWSIDGVLIPHFGHTDFSSQEVSQMSSKGIEVGINGGICIYKTIIHDQWYFYTLLSLGPHYVSDVPNRQRIGFIFSDNVAMGQLFRVLKGGYLDLNIGIRHISNANTRYPNEGINNIIFSGGFLFEI